MQRKEQTVRQQLREWYYDTPRKRGPKRQALRVETCFAPLLGWVVSWWQGTQLALAIDATTLGHALCGAGRQCGLSRLCDPGGVGDPARGRQTRLAAGMAAPAAPAAAGHPPRLDGDRAGRSRLVCPVAVSAHHAPGLASVFAHQHGRQLSARRGDLLAALDDALCRGPGRVGAARASPLRATRSPARCWPAGRTATKTRG